MSADFVLRFIGVMGGGMMLGGAFFGFWGAIILPCVVLAYMGYTEFYRVNQKRPTPPDLSLHVRHKSRPKRDLARSHFLFTDKSFKGQDTIEVEDVPEARAVTLTVLNRTDSPMWTPAVSTVLGYEEAVLLRNHLDAWLEAKR